MSRTDRGNRQERDSFPSVTKNRWAVKNILNVKNIRSQIFVLEPGKPNMGKPTLKEFEEAFLCPNNSNN